MKQIMIAVVMIGSIGALIQAQEARKERVFVSAESKKIRKVVKLYYEGVTRADRSKLELAWAKHQSYVNFVKKDENGVDQVFTVETQTAFDWWTRESARTGKGEVLTLDIVDDKMAFVKLDLHFNKQRFIDYLTLYKLNNEWKIIQRSFLRRPDAT